MEKIDGIVKLIMQILPSLAEYGIENNGKFYRDRFDDAIKSIESKLRDLCLKRKCHLGETYLYDDLINALLDSDLYPFALEGAVTNGIKGQLLEKFRDARNINLRKILSQNQIDQIDEFDFSNTFGKKEFTPKVIDGKKLKNKWGKKYSDLDYLKKRWIDLQLSTWNRQVKTFNDLFFQRTNAQKI